MRRINLYRVKVGFRDRSGARRPQMIANVEAVNARWAEQKALKLAQFVNAEIFECKRID